ncbi:hypothetical protein [Prochlorococcus sp. MIT 0801]|uniref:hypothetical protein n=1 Tax=Prochlorococcus sp. MIT 0801 TaxID=1501269 RepID=UPI0004F746F4|nr:hypothetical protein [Prochlorococcus sp. MIT 0801]AIQ97141.1 hypothetical protein EW15_1049 [Prochlorococcus sp. MIT 0801]
MNDSISWDPSLVKKFSSSNHYKLLNQLRNEVKKYPLNNKKNSISIQPKDFIDKKNKSNVPPIQNSSFSKGSNQNKQVNSNKSTVSFNNAKNFSIYNQTKNNNIGSQNDSSFNDLLKSNVDSCFTTFNERLDNVEMK